MTRLRIIFAGSGEFGLPTLRRLVESGGHPVVQVISQPDHRAGRGLKLTPTAISRFALESGLPLVRTAKINELRLPEADVLVVIAFGQKIAPHIVDHARLGSINLHASRLPLYRGAAPINWAIINGESITGNSVIRLANKMDAGPVLRQSSIEIDSLETAGEVHDRLAQDGVELIVRVLDDLAGGTAVETPQDDASATLAPKLKREHSAIDWQRAGRSIANQIRGMYPWPGCRVRLVEDGQEVARVTLVRAVPAQAAPVSPGLLLPSGDVSTGDAAMRIVELQPEGKRPMSLDAYRNGHRWEAGMRLESIAAS